VELVAISHAIFHLHAPIWTIRLRTIFPKALLIRASSGRVGSEFPGPDQPQICPSKWCAPRYDHGERRVSYVSYAPTYRTADLFAGRSIITRVKVTGSGLAATSILKQAPVIFKLVLRHGWTWPY